MSFPTISDRQISEAFRVRDIGIDATALLAGKGAEIAAVFTRSLYLKNGGRWACIGPMGLGNGPLNVLCGLPHDLDWKDRGLIPGQKAAFSGGAITLSSTIELNFRQAKTWRPPTPGSWTVETLFQGLCTVDAVENPRPPDQGLGIFGFPGRDPVSSESRRAAPAIKKFETWLRTGHKDRYADPPGLPALAETLIGLGPGLTPSGDDFIGGAMIALHLVGRGTGAANLWRIVAALTESHTVDVSAAHLRAAAEGRGHEMLHRTLNAILSGDGPSIPTGLVGLDRIGHCSGWDALAGALLVLRELAGTQTAT